MWDWIIDFLAGVLAGIEVVLLYPEGKISRLQECRRESQ